MTTKDELENVLEQWSSYYSKEDYFIQLQEKDISVDGYVKYILSDVEKLNSKQRKRKVGSKT